jgi:predicted nucleotidyltransferase
MNPAERLDLQTISRACEARGVSRLRIFGSVLGYAFDREISDVDFLVDFLPGRGGLLHDYFDLKEDLERIVGAKVDLVEASALRNPYFARSVLCSAEDIYAA